MNKFGSLIVRVARVGAGLVGEGQSAVPGARECGVRDFCASNIHLMEAKYFHRDCGGLGR